MIVHIYAAVTYLEKRHSVNKLKKRKGRTRESCESLMASAHVRNDGPVTGRQRRRYTELGVKCAPKVMPTAGRQFEVRVEGSGGVGGLWRIPKWYCFSPETPESRCLRWYADVPIKDSMYTPACLNPEFKHEAKPEDVKQRAISILGELDSMPKS